MQLTKISIWKIKNISNGNCFKNKRKKISISSGGALKINRKRFTWSFTAKIAMNFFVRVLRRNLSAALRESSITKAITRLRAVITRIRWFRAAICQWLSSHECEIEMVETWWTHSRGLGVIYRRRKRVFLILLRRWYLSSNDPYRLSFYRF